MNESTHIKVGIAGGAGYTGGELIRLLLQHPFAELVFIHSKSHGGKSISQVHPDLLGDTELTFSVDLTYEIDVLFLCLGHGESQVFIEAHKIPDRIKIIDLSQDFRLNKSKKFVNRSFVYGLPELNKTQIQSADNIANPGCFATAIQLALLPLAEAGLLRDIYATGITGSTGAGQSLSATTHFSWRANNISAYKTLDHQHINEITESLQQLQPGYQPDLHFVPWRGDFTRGIFVSITVGCDLSQNEIQGLYERYYADACSTHISREMIGMKQVVNTNKCLIYPEIIGNKLVVHATIDNLLKGASGQAVQNMNIMFGLEETTGLKLKASAF